MFEIPLFPLQAVLFPGAPLHLRIFEERYKQLVDYCKKTGSPFGVSLIKRGVEANGPLAVPYPVGCTAKIAHIKPLEQGQVNLLAIGQERFRIVLVKKEFPFPVAIVEPFPLEIGDRNQLTIARRDLTAWYERYLNVLTTKLDLDNPIKGVPDDPLAFAYLAAMMLQIPPDQKQNLLELESSLDLFESLRYIYRKELALMDKILSMKSEGGTEFITMN